MSTPKEQHDVALPASLERALQAARHVFVLTGAGASAESGVPTFREAQTGLWEKFDPLELASPAGFARDPETVWDWYRWRRQLVRDAAPNAGLRALARLERQVDDFTLVTQNVDSLHQCAGSRNVIEYHGNLFETHCNDCGAAGEDDGCRVPACPACGGPLRPGVVWFGENIPGEAAERSLLAASRAELCLCVGTSSSVYPAAALVSVAREAGAYTVEINPDPVGGSLFDCVLAGPAGLILPKLAAVLDNNHRGDERG